MSEYIHMRRYHRNMYVVRLSSSHKMNPTIRIRLVCRIYRALDGGHQCHMSILRNGNVPCRYFSNVHVDFIITKCPLSNLRKCLCHVGNIYSHVDKLHVTCRF